MAFVLKMPPRYTSRKWSNLGTIDIEIEKKVINIFERAIQV
jgi:hypothetical protein